MVSLDDGTELHCASVTLAMGVQYARLEGEGVERLTGAGIYYGGVSTETAAITGQRRSLSVVPTRRSGRTPPRAVRERGHHADPG